jgi:hypothetical protein
VLALVVGGLSVPAVAGNLIVNGSFEQVNPAPVVYGEETPFGFLTDYFLDSRNGQGASGAANGGSGFGYAGIVTNSSAWHGSFDTFGAQDGSNFFIVNGAGPTYTVWEQDVTGANAGTTYEFSFWARNAYPSSPADIDITAYMGNTVLATFNASLAQSNPSPNGQWVRFSALWSGLADPTKIRLVDNNGAFSGNDFAIDNIRLDAVIPLPQHMGVAGLLGVLAIRRRRAS